MGQPEEDFAPGDHLTPDERDPEVSPEDAVEQATVADPTIEEQSDVPRGLEVNEADAIEQAQVVGPEDDYR
ncbi:hypothetical protein I0C86_17415 [Plantactinospora sp. S1510]|jgi:hypothetical protein|uniref:DUF5709 domain-containing protein n=1 Tax=Plantactinospora alkalitolerans TaxID=2789879 RepID=A0ABS0GX15_9ACTN|nr:hypothetical protein [Plantactinospora alkalitolerans]MBF9130725.1 hypothetical protein [Plantactinospora alkalitolerans]